MRLGSLFTGIGGIDCAFEQAGCEIAWQCECDAKCRRVLARHWPSARVFRDAHALPEDCPSPDILAGGDPCQCRSQAMRRFGSKALDLSGYFLLAVAQLSPQWVFRENVRAADTRDFVEGLELLGYHVATVDLDGAQFTACCRPRTYVVGCLDPAGAGRFEHAVAEAEDDLRHGPLLRRQRQTALPCILASDGRRGYSGRATLVYEPGSGLRTLSAAECERALGFPRRWTAGLSTRDRRRLLGNSVCVPAVRWIAERIVIADTGEH